MYKINDWSDLIEKCPINLRTIHKYYEEFYSYFPSKINETTLNISKETLLISRGHLDSMFATLTQLLYDKSMLKEKEDNILFAWLIDNLGRYLKKLDAKEFELLIKHDSPIDEKSNVGLSRITSYARILQTSVDSLIYESLVKATMEYLELEKDERNNRSFLYILFQVINITMSIMGGLAREETGSRKGMVNTIPTTWQNLMSSKGGDFIKEGYQEETGIDIDKFKSFAPLIEGDTEEDED